jgi:hypothetical protein
MGPCPVTMREREEVLGLRAVQRALPVFGPGVRAPRVGALGAAPRSASGFRRRLPPPPTWLKTGLRSCDEAPVCHCGFCSKTCRVPKGKYEHGRRKDVCKDCGTVYFQHGRQKHTCKDCGTGYCQHGRQKHVCKGCGTGRCEHGRRGGQCRGC